GEHGAYTMNPLIKAFNEDRSYTIFPWQEDPFFYNPLTQTLALDDDVTNKVFTNNFLDVKLPFIPGFSYRLNTGVEYYSWEQGTYFGRNTSRGTTNGGEADVRNRVGENYTVENIINYDRNFNKHTLKFTGLYSFQQQKFEDRRLQSMGFTSDLLSYYQASQGTVITPSYAVSESVILSSMARINYGYDGKYLLTLTGRRDGYSAFGENTKYGFFPSAAIAWNVHNETFFVPLESVMSSLKLRVSYGKSGNQAVPAYETLSKYGERNYVFGESTSAGFFPTTLGAPDLGWETNTALNIGVDFGLFKDRVQANLDFYRANISDLLFPLQIPSIYGPTEITANAAEVRNTGFEFSVSSYNVNKGAFTWTTDFNTSYNINEIMDLPGGIDDVSSKLFIGRPITQNYGLKFEGIWQEGDDFLSSAQPDAYPGDVKVADIGGGPNGGPNGKIDVDEDRTFQGQRDPKVIWGMNNNFSYGNFSLSVFMHGVHGVTRIFDVEPNVYTGVRRNTIKRDYWSSDNPSNKFPANRISIEGINNYPGVNPYGVYNYVSADFIRVKDITLAYDVPSSVLAKLGLSTLKIYVNTRNLLTFTKYPGLDPELSSQDEIPLQKEFILGLNVGL
ncbi:MAG: SusC/RagA family TonB-linked outer membrane protein, partial [Cyclobacteriaceae bacterium]